MGWTRAMTVPQHVLIAILFSVNIVLHMLSRPLFFNLQRQWRYVFGDAVLQLVHGSQPELGAFVLFDPEAHDFRTSCFRLP
jgi:hypothetical protein